MQKLKSKELPAWKREQMVKQGFKCPLCGGSLSGIPLAKLAADHCHETGNLRSVLHMSCNRAEGIILKAATTWLKQKTLKDRVASLRALASYWEEHRRNPSRVMYPTHKTPEQIKEAQLRKMKKAALARKAKKETK